MIAIVFMIISITIITYILIMMMLLYEHFCYTFEGVQRKVKNKISLIPRNHIYQV